VRFEPVPDSRGCCLLGAGDRLGRLHVLTSGLVSRLASTQNGASMEFAISGSEGAVGIASFLGRESMPSEAVALCDGHAYRLRLCCIEDEIEHHTALLHQLLRYAHALVAQTRQIATCSRHHMLDQRLCRWLPTSLDPFGSSELTVMQELIAHMRACAGRASRRPLESCK
jgi:CRP-like cAMP-binding protein